MKSTYRLWSLSCLAVVIAFVFQTAGPLNHRLVAGAAAANPVAMEFTATIQTITGTPFGLGAGDRTKEVSGFFTYDPATADTNANAQKGDYPQTNGQFRITLPNGNVVTGSGAPFLQVENFEAPTSDTFRFIDGPRTVGPEGGNMFLNGATNTSIELLIAISDGAGTTFSNDDLPDPFPFTTGNIPTHTFSLKDTNGTASMRFTAILPTADPNAGRRGDNAVRKDALRTKIKKLKKKIRLARKKGQTPKAKRLTKKLKRLIRLLKSL